MYCFAVMKGYEVVYFVNLHDDRNAKIVYRSLGFQEVEEMMTVSYGTAVQDFRQQCWTMNDDFLEDVDEFNQGQRSNDFFNKYPMFQLYTFARTLFSSTSLTLNVCKVFTCSRAEDYLRRIKESGLENVVSASVTLENLVEEFDDEVVHMKAFVVDASELKQLDKCMENIKKELRTLGFDDIAMLL